MAQLVLAILIRFFHWTTIVNVDVQRLQFRTRLGQVFQEAPDFSNGVCQV